MREEAIAGVNDMPKQPGTGGARSTIGCGGTLPMTIEVVRVHMRDSRLQSPKMSHEGSRQKNHSLCCSRVTGRNIGKADEKPIRNVASSTLMSVVDVGPLRKVADGLHARLGAPS